MRGGAVGLQKEARTQEIHVISSGARDEARLYSRGQGERDWSRYEPMTFSNTPFRTKENGKKAYRSASATPKWRYVFVASLIAVDLAVMFFSLTISLLVNDAAFDTIGTVMPFWLFLVFFGFIWVLCLTFAGTYHRHVMAEGYELYAKILNASLLTIVSYCCLAFVFKLALPRTALIVAPIIALFLEIGARWQMRCGLHANRRKGSCKYKTVIVGSSDGINRALRTMNDCSNWGYEPVAVCPIEADTSSDDAYVVTAYTPDPNIPGADRLKVVSFNSAFPVPAKASGRRKCTSPTCFPVIPTCCTECLWRWNPWAWNSRWPYLSPT